MKLDLAACLLASCASTGGGGGHDLAQLAKQVELVRLDVMDLAYLAQPETQEDLRAFSLTVMDVEAALRIAAEGGSVSSVTAAAEAALLIAERLVARAEPGSDLRFCLALARIAMRHIAAARFEEAATLTRR
jgi:hypothetical protein